MVLSVLVGGMGDRRGEYVVCDITSSNITVTHWYLVLFVVRDIGLKIQKSR